MYFAIIFAIALGWAAFLLKTEARRRAFCRFLAYVTLAGVGGLGLIIWLMLSAQQARPALSAAAAPVSYKVAAAVGELQPIILPDGTLCMETGAVDPKGIIPRCMDVALGAAQPAQPEPKPATERTSAIAACFRRLGVDISHPPADMGADDGRVRYCRNNWHQEILPAPLAERTSGWFYDDDHGDHLGPFATWKDAKADCRSRALAYCDGTTRYFTVNVPDAEADVLLAPAQAEPQPPQPQAERTDMYQKSLRALLGENLTPLGN